MTVKKRRFGKHYYGLYCTEQTKIDTDRVVNKLHKQGYLARSTKTKIGYRIWRFPI